MRKSILFVLLLACISPVYGQYTPFPTIDSLDINNIHASVLVHGDMWWDTEEGKSQSFIAGTNKGINFAGSLWMSGFDAGNNLHVSSQTYRQDGCDYWPGPLESSAPIDYASSQKWAKIWKVNGSDVVNFNSLTTHTIANTPPSILSWPGNGNAFAEGNGGALLNIGNDLAPFVDLNGNGVYEPLQGEYPDFPGDQALWYIFNDNGPAHNTTTSGKFFGLEIHAMSYGYNRGSLLDNVVYYDYTIVNRSNTDYHDMRLGLWDDADLGWYYDDFLGFDSSRRLGICYNGTNDDGGGGGHPSGSFGERPPMMGVTLISIPGDIANNTIPAGAFALGLNAYNLINSLKNDSEVNDRLHGMWRKRNLYSFDYQGTPTDTTDVYVPYVFPGDPGDTDQISECSNNNLPADRIFVLSTNDFDLPAGSSQHILMAMVVTDTGVGGGCGGTSFAKIREVSDTAWAAYRNPPTSLHKHTPATGGSGPTEIKSWPNPAKDRVYISGDDNAVIAVYNAMGQVIYVPVVKNGARYELDVSGLPKGLYNAVYGNGKTRGSYKFLKE